MPRRGSMWQQGWLLLLASCTCIRAAFLGGVWGEKIALEINQCASGSDAQKRERPGAGWCICLTG